MLWQSCYVASSASMCNGDAFVIMSSLLILVVWENMCLFGLVFANSVLSD